MSTPNLLTQVYCLHNDHILLMRRNKPPNLDLWVAPGGKVEKDESPIECAARELKEEAGLTAANIELKGFVTLVIPTFQYALIHFLYFVSQFHGELQSDGREGSLQWLPLSMLDQVTMPQANRIFLPRIIQRPQIFYQAKYIYNEAEQIVEVIEYGS